MATIGAAPATQWQDEQLAAAPKTAKGHNFGASDGAGRLRRGASAAAPTDPRSSSSGCPAALRHLTPTDHEQLMPLRSPSGFSSRGRRRHAARHARRRPPALALPIQRALLRAAPNRMQPPPRPRVGLRRPRRGPALAALRTSGCRGLWPCVSAPPARHKRRAVVGTQPGKFRPKAMHLIYPLHASRATPVHCVGPGFIPGPAPRPFHLARSCVTRPGCATRRPRLRWTPSTCPANRPGAAAAGFD